MTAPEGNYQTGGPNPPVPVETNEEKVHAGWRLFSLPEKVIAILLVVDIALTVFN